MARTAAYDAVALATKGPVTAWVIVPRAGRTPESLLARFARSGWARRADAAARPQPLMLELPRLHTTFSAPDLKPELQAMGMVSAFSPQQAELQGIVAPGTPGRVYISASCTRPCSTSTRAASRRPPQRPAIVGITAAPYAPLTIRADRPFLLLLTDKRTSAPLFMALISDPRA